MRPLALLLAFALAGCGLTTPEGGPSDAGVVDAGPGGAQPQPYDLGVLHPLGQADAINLRPPSDGVAVEASYGCDIFHVTHGTWSLQADGGVAVSVGRSFVLCEEDGGWVAYAAIYESSVNPTHFRPGGICAVCGNLGPSSLVPCDTPWGLDGG